MHILILTQHNVLAPQYGGALRVACLLEQLLNHSFHVSVIRFRLRGEPPSRSQAHFPVRDIVLPPGYLLPAVAILTHVLSRAADRLALGLHLNQRINLIQSDPPWTALTGLRVARKLKIAHVLLSQNCESTLAAEISKTGPARRIPLVGRRLADFNVAALSWAEKQAMQEADLALTPSTLDRQAMASVGIPTQQVEILPNGTNVRPSTVEARLEMRRQLGLGPHAPVAVFVGRLDYPPNLEAVKTLCIHIAPHCPNVTFLVAGINPPKIAPPNNVRLIGFVDQIERYLGAGDLAVVPITVGSGTRIKILDAWAAGLPVLSTSAAASGLEYGDGVNIVIEDNLAQFPARIEELFHSPEKLAALKQGALEAVIPYRWETIGLRYVERLKLLVAEAS